MRKSKMEKGRITGFIFENIFRLSSILSIVALLVILGYIVYAGAPAMFEVGLRDFLGGMEWRPTKGLFGILPMIVGSIGATLGAILVGVPIGILTAVFLAEVAPEWLARIVRPAVELLAGIPSVIYGFFGLLVIIPIIHSIFGNGGDSMLAAIIILSIMILPTIITITETSLRAVPRSYKEGALALGASHIQTIFQVMIPAARSGILSGVVLGIGRAIGETMAVILVIGNSIKMPSSILDRGRTMTANIALEMSYAAGLHQRMLFATGVILLVFIMILNFILLKLTQERKIR